MASHIPRIAVACDLLRERGFDHEADILERVTDGARARPSSDPGNYVTLGDGSGRRFVAVNRLMVHACMLCDMRLGDDHNMSGCPVAEIWGECP